MGQDHKAPSAGEGALWQGKDGFRGGGQRLLPGNHLRKSRSLSCQIKKDMREGDAAEAWRGRR